MHEITTKVRNGRVRTGTLLLQTPGPVLPGPVAGGGEGLGLPGAAPRAPALPSAPNSQPPLPSGTPSRPGAMRPMPTCRRRGDAEHPRGASQATGPPAFPALLRPGLPASGPLPPSWLPGSVREMDSGRFRELRSPRAGSLPRAHGNPPPGSAASLRFRLPATGLRRGAGAPPAGSSRDLRPGPRSQDTTADQRPAPLSRVLTNPLLDQTQVRLL